MHIVLLGYRASGKTSTGRALAGALAMPFVDLDERLVDRMRMPVAEAFRRYGEAWFRAAEATELEKVLAEPASVIALGGGTPCAPAAAEVLQQARAAHKARTVYLRASAATLQARLLGADNTHRPSLTGAGHPADEVDVVLKRRTPQYQSAADIVIDVDALTPEQAVKAVAAAL